MSNDALLSFITGSRVHKTRNRDGFVDLTPGAMVFGRLDRGMDRVRLSSKRV